MIASAVGTASDHDFQAYFNADGYIGVYLRGALNLSTLTTYTDNTYHHVVVTWDGTTAKIYIDGFLDDGNATVGTSLEDTAEPIVIGARTSGTGFRLTGQVDETRIYNRALNSTEVAALYAFTGDTTGPTPPTSVVATALSVSSILITWSPSTDDSGGIITYIIKRCPGAGCSAFVQVDTSTVTNYVDTGLSSSTLYRYKVQAEDTSFNVSAESSIAEATTFGASAGSLRVLGGRFLGGRLP
jgi:hypothetical protein